MKALLIVLLASLLLTVGGCSGGVSVSASTSGSFHPFAKSEHLPAIVGEVPILSTSTGKSFETSWNRP